MTHEGLVKELREYASKGQKFLGGGSLCIRAAGAIDILDRLCDRYEAENKQRSDTIHALVVECNWLRAENKKLTKALGDSFAIDLMNKLEKAERERDAAINDLRECSIEDYDECIYCSHRSKYTMCQNCINGKNWEWRGLKDENNS